MIIKDMFLVERFLATRETELQIKCDKIKNKIVFCKKFVQKNGEKRSLFFSIKNPPNSSIKWIIEEFCQSVYPLYLSKSCLEHPLELLNEMMDLRRV